MNKTVQASMVYKNKANAKLRTLNVNVARILESTFRMLGMDELADRIRPFTTKRRKSVKSSEDTTPDDTTPGEHLSRREASLLCPSREIVQKKRNSHAH
jgi:hypothetical protein